MYSAPDGVAFAIEELDAPGLAITPAHLLGMSVKYRVAQWFKPNFRQLAMKPLHTLDPKDLNFIPPTVLRDLLVARHDVDFGRRELVRMKPAIYRNRTTSVICGRDSCADKMQHLWDTVMESMLSSKIWYSSELIINAFLLHLRSSEICCLCQAIYYSSLREMVLAEVDTVEEAAEKAFAAQGFEE